MCTLAIHVTVAKHACLIHMQDTCMDDSKCVTHREQNCMVTETQHDRRLSYR